VSGYVSLRKIGAGWEFESEAALEDFVWANLQPLFGLTPLKQQYCVSGQFCDLLAVGENKQLVVLELKNVEDRYIVQQLTRYYDALLEEKPFSEEVDYGQPVCLVAIAPTFHRDNFTDRKYHTLSFRFLQFAIVQDGGEFYLQLTDLDSGKIFQSEIPHQERESPENIPSPPRALLNLLAKCTDDEREAILKIRIKLLSFDQRMQEMTATGSVTYGKGKNNCCAELRLDKQSGKLILFLSIPYAHKWTEKRFIARMRVWTDWKSVSDVAHVPKGMGKTKISQAEYESGRRPKSRNYYMHRYPSYKCPLTADFKYYMELVNKQSNSLDSLVDLALETWLARL
jgi:RecB family endonuclease NucS